MKKQFLIKFSLILFATTIAGYFLFYVGNDDQIRQPSKNNPLVGKQQAETEFGLKNSDGGTSLGVWINAAAPKGDFAKMDPVEFAKVAPAINGHPSYLRARSLIECRAYDQSIQKNDNAIFPPNSPDVETYLFFREVERLRCLNIDRRNYDNIEALMKDAADSGDKNALIYINKNILNADVFEVSPEKKAADSSLIISTPSEETLVAAKKLIDLAFTGEKSAIAQAYIITGTSRYGMEDPIASAAWKIILNQDPRMNSPDFTLDNKSLSSEFSPADREKITATAKSYYLICCNKSDPDPASEKLR